MPASFVRLFLVRHAEALANPDLRYLGSRDDPLTERGQWQARQLAHAFAPLALAAVYTSPLTRAVSTALPLAEVHGLSIIPEPRLVEAAMGRGKACAAPRFWRAALTTSRATTSGRRIRPVPHPAASPSRPSRRVVACVQDLAERHAGAAVVLVSHVGPIKAPRVPRWACH